MILIDTAIVLLLIVTKQITVGNFCIVTRSGAGELAERCKHLDVTSAFGADFDQLVKAPRAHINIHPIGMAVF